MHVIEKNTPREWNFLDSKQAIEINIESLATLPTFFINSVSHNNDAKATFSSRLLNLVLNSVQCAVSLSGFINWHHCRPGEGCLLTTISAPCCRCLSESIRTRSLSLSWCDIILIYDFLNALRLKKMLACYARSSRTTGELKKAKKRFSQVQ